MPQYGRQSVPELLDDLAARFGTRTAILADDSTVSFEELRLRVRRVAGGLDRLGVAAGDRVAIWLPNSMAWLELSFACAHLGAIAVAVNTRFRSAEVEDIVGRSGAKVLALWPGFKKIDFLSILEDVPAAALEQLETLVVLGEEQVLPGSFSDKRLVRYRELEREPPVERTAAGPDVGCNIFTTSGTTKAPKFVLHPQRSISDHAHDVAAGFGFREPASTILQVLPFCGVFGFSQAMGTLASGNPMVLPLTFEAEPAAAAIKTYGITHMNGTDDMFLNLLETDDQAEHPFPSLKSCGFAGFTMEPESVVAIGDKRGIPLVGLYGMSELQALFARQSLDDTPAQRALGGGQLISPKAEIRVRDPESGALLADGEPGELEAAGPSRMAEYYGNSDATQETLTEDGFVRTGDLGYTVLGGFVYQSRMGDALRLGGFLVSPAEISGFIENLSGVEACQVVGVNGDRGLEVVAFVVPEKKAPATSEAILESCRSGLARFKVPRAIFNIDAFPVTESANGVKIQLTKLRNMAAQKLGRR